MAGPSRIEGATLRDLIGGFLQVPHVAIWVKDRDLRYVHVSPAWEARAGLSRDVVLGRRDDEFRPADLADRFQARDREVMELGEPETREERHETANGVRSYVFTKFPLRTTDGEVVGVVGISSETTEIRSAAGADAAGLPIPEAVLASMAEPIFRFTPDLVVTFANASFLALYDRWDTHPVGRSLDDVFSPAFAGSFRTAVARLTASTPSASFERESRHYDGRSRWRYWRLDGSFDSAGRLVEAQAVGTDITDQKSYQDALERLLSTTGRPDAPLTDVLHDVLRIGRDYFVNEFATIFRFTATGPVVGYHTGGPPPDTAVTNALTAVPFLADEPTAVADSRRQSSEPPGVGTFIGQRIDVGEPWGVVVFHGRWPRPAPYSHYALSLLNVLSRWIAMAVERSDRLAEISRGRAALSLILDNVPAQVVTVAPDGVELTSNTAARMVPRPPSSQAADREMLSSGRPRSSQLERWEEGDGDVRWMQTDRIAFSDPATGERRLLVVAYDVTGSVLKEHALAKANEGLTQFAYIASHDLQEPLRKIGTFVDILLEGMASGQAEDVTYATRVIKDSARRASALIKDLLAWSRLTNRPLALRPLAFAACVREVVEDVLAARPGAELEVVDEMTDLVVPADETQVRQLVENLVTNAVKYKHPDRPGRITLRLARTGRRHGMFEVEDNGIGFDQIHAAQIFEPFRRLHSERDYAGTGVGLAICARVCEQHGWTIRGRGRPGVGATFQVTLTVDADAPPATPRPDP